MKKNKPVTRKLKIVSGFVVALVILVISFFTILDSEWRGGQVLTRLRVIYTQLETYKKSKGVYPESLKEIGVNSRYCLLLFCYDLKYRTNLDKQNMYMATLHNDPFVAYLRSGCDPESTISCSGFAITTYYEYDGDFPMYGYDEGFKIGPESWPALK